MSVSAIHITESKQAWSRGGGGVVEVTRIPQYPIFFASDNNVQI